MPTAIGETVPEKNNRLPASTRAFSSVRRAARHSGFKSAPVARCRIYETAFARTQENLIEVAFSFTWSLNPAPFHQAS